ncbi:MAG TPA: ABC transporter ATP-binding protein [Candidatus Faecivivens stercoravium]|uniref:ABC transporter ATP-binding protein n=1 Tax=Candidatus Faecivivens stercoravium TaxID=2840803 RepID=A0A9D1DYE8_9FIRM|nr:ABC transporter ATP-binding protein [Candidatus Faecivivens stercoravium]
MIKKLAACVGEYKKFAIATPFIMLGEAVMDIVLPLIMANMIDYGIQAKDMGYTIRMGLLMILCTLFALICGAGGGITAAHAATGFAKNLRAKLFKKVQTFSFSNIDRFSTASLVTRLTTDVTNTQNAFQMLIRMAVRSPVMLIGAAIMAIRINPELSAIFLVVIPILGISLFLIMSKAHPRFEAMMEKYDALNNSVQENLSAIRVVKAFVREDYEDKKFKNSADNVRRAQLFAEKLVILNSPIMQLCMYGCILAVLWFGGNMVIGGTFEIGKLSSFISYVTQTLMSLMMLSMVIMMITVSLASMHRIVEVLDEEPDLKEDADPVMEVKDGSIEFNHVDFSYSGKTDNLILKDINLSIKSGETIGVIGGTGSAKSTLVQLIPRLYDIEGGEIKVGGVNVRKYDTEVLRNQVAMVLQKNVLFSGTIRDNLKWGNENATDEEILKACKAADAYEFIESFPYGLDTDLGQGGVNVSGGQKQRLCIARALLKRPKIIILDDSTSAVDTATDARIRAAFRKELDGTTTIIIAQRITSVQDADKVIVLDEGRIDAFDTPENLLKTNAIYREVYEQQQKGAQE